MLPVRAAGEAFAGRVLVGKPLVGKLLVGGLFVRTLPVEKMLFFGLSSELEQITTLSLAK
ncbi:hypothetical protein AUP68_00963 [Ilyonectria robusta]